MQELQKQAPDWPGVQKLSTVQVGPGGYLQHASHVGAWQHSSSMCTKHTRQLSVLRRLENALTQP